MRIKILKLGEAAKEVEVTDGSTVNDVIQQSNFRREHQTIMLNGQPAFETATVSEGDIITMNPSVKGGRYD
ncbi:MAG: MoaD/ThiS family protein [bacterium]|nr:MoaD/ThiS family protein [bacterium]